MASSNISHTFNDDSNTNVSLTSSDSRVTVSAQAQSDPGGPFQQSASRKHYLITISDANITSNNDVTITDVSSTSASGLGFNVQLRAVERVSSTQVRVYFSGDGVAVGENSYCRSFTVNWSGQVDGGTDNRTEGPSECPAPTPWESLLPTCASPPTPTSTTNGLQISKTGNSQITLNLRNYAGRLVSLKITHQTSASWQNGFSFTIAQASDISPNTGGSAYSKSGFSNSSMSGTNTWYVYNVDGGDYDYVFDHTSVPGARPTRTNYNLVCTTSTSTETSTNADGDTVTTEVSTTTCVCEPYTETYGGTWPHCPVGVAIAKNGGSEVRWVYEDGGGTPYSDQVVTIQVVGERSVVPASGQICVQTLKDSLWIADPAPGSSSKVGNCVNDYRSHSTAFSEKRFRDPASRTSATSFSDPVCYSELRGFAGAKTPTEWGFS